MGDTVSERKGHSVMKGGSLWMKCTWEEEEKRIGGGRGGMHSLGPYSEKILGMGKRG